MKYLVLSFTISLLCFKGNAQAIVNGYYVSLSKDSIAAKINLPKTLFGFKEIVEINQGSCISLPEL